MLSCSIWLSALSFWMGGGLESHCVGHVYGADGAADSFIFHFPGCWQVLSLTRKETSSETCQGRARFRQHRDASYHQVFFLQGKALKEIHASLTETLACFLPGRATDLSAPLYITRTVLCYVVHFQFVSVGLESCVTKTCEKLGHRV